MSTGRYTSTHRYEYTVSIKPTATHLLHSEKSSAKTTLINMVGTAGAARTRTELLPIGEVDVNTSFNAYANKYLIDNRDGNAMHGTRLIAREILHLKKSWHKLFAHCVQQICQKVSQGYTRSLANSEPH